MTTNDANDAQLCTDDAHSRSAVHTPPATEPSSIWADAELAAAEKCIAAASAVDHPSHYTHGRFETIAVIEDWQLGFHLGNAVKYISRAGRKDPAKTVEDLKKARWYLDRYITTLEGGE